jgi:hypothetical protein
MALSFPSDMILNFQFSPSPALTLTGPGYFKDANQVKTTCAYKCTVGNEIRVSANKNNVVFGSFFLPKDIENCNCKIYSLEGPYIGPKSTVIYTFLKGPEGLVSLKMDITSAKESYLTVNNVKVPVFALSAVDVPVPHRR